MFYLPDRRDWEQAVQTMESHGNPAIPAFNAYWDDCGKAYQGPEGYRVVLQDAAWNR